MNSLEISFVEKVKFSWSNGIVLLKFIHKTGMSLFAYLEVDKPGLEKLTQCYEKQVPVTLSDYGKVISFGKGEPNQQMKDFIEALEL